MGYEIKRYHGSYNISPVWTAYRYIVVHYVGSGTSAPGSARANCAYFAGGNRNASAHYFIDDAYIYEYADPRKYYTWHVGDGGGRYGITNSNAIGIEVCINGDRPYTDAELPRLRWLVQRLMAEYCIPAERVVRHYDESRKACPYYYTPYGSGGNPAWRSLHAYLTAEEDEVTDQDKEDIALRVWNMVLDGSGGSDRAAWRMLSEAAREATRTDDPSGRGVAMNDHDHIKWLAAGQAAQNETLAAIVDALGKVTDKLDAVAQTLDGFVPAVEPEEGATD